MPSTNPSDDVKDDGLQVNLPDCLPASSRADSLERPITSREIRNPDPNYAALLKRVEGLELHRRALIFIAVVACVASLISLNLMYKERDASRQLAKEWPAAQQRVAEPQAAQQPGIVEATQVFLCDAAGNRRDSIKLDERGGIAFHDVNGVKRALFYHNPEGPTWLHLFASDGTQRASIGVLKDGMGLVDLCDDGRKNIVLLHSYGLTLHEGERRLGQFANVNGTAGITLFDKKGAILFSKP
jgi:hypothetical protein